MIFEKRTAPFSHSRQISICQVAILMFSRLHNNTNMAVTVAENTSLLIWDGNYFHLFAVDKTRKPQTLFLVYSQWTEKIQMFMVQTYSNRKYRQKY